VVLIRRFNSNEQLVPVMVSTRLGGAATTKRPVQHLNVRDQILLRPPPVGQFSAAGTGHLVPEEFDNAFVNPVVVWFNDPLAVFVVEPKQAFLFDGRPDYWVDVRIGVGDIGLPLFDLRSTFHALRSPQVQDAPYRCPSDLQPTRDF
jgi:hypothetical protein